MITSSGQYAVILYNSSYRGNRLQVLMIDKDRSEVRIKSLEGPSSMSFIKVNASRKNIKVCMPIYTICKQETTLLIEECVTSKHWILGLSTPMLDHHI